MALAEYTPPGSPSTWKVEKIDALCSDFGLTPKQLPDFHKACCELNAWPMICSLFGIFPVIVPIDSNPDDYQVLSKAEYCHRYDKTEDDIDPNLHMVKAVWERQKRHNAALALEKTEKPKRAVSKKSAPAVEEKPDEIPPEPPRVELAPMSDRDLQDILRRHGYSDDYFKHLNRSPIEADAERQWLALRLQEFDDFFNDPRTQSTILNALNNELALRRINARMAREEVDSVKYADLQETKSRIEKGLEAQWKQVEDLNPRAARSARKQEVIGTIWDMIKAIRDFYTDKNNELIDGFHTAFEIQILLRESEQHQVRYRLGQTAAIIEAMAGLYDPFFKRKFSDFQCKQLDMGFREGCRMVRENSGIPMPNLELEGPAGEYPNLHEPTEPVKIDDEVTHDDANGSGA